MSKLPGRSLKSFGLSHHRPHQLWLSPEYLLYREITGYKENVRRYYYGDIQAVVMGPTSAWKICAIVSALTIVACVWAGIYLVQSGGELAFVFPAILGSIASIIFIGNLILGPTCKTILYTATTEARLFSLGRRRSAEKAIATLLPFIEHAQPAPVLSPEAVVAEEATPLGELARPVEPESDAVNGVDSDNE